MRSGIRKPKGKSNGFIALGERLRWQGVPGTLADFVRAFRVFRAEYNDVRPHAALEMEPPAMRFTPSRRAYAEMPKPWAYAGEIAVRRVQRNGIIRFNADWHFVSEALWGEDVGCLPLGDRVLVRYRHMYVRELHLRDRRSIPLLEPVTTLSPADATTSTGYDDESAMS